MRDVIAAKSFTAIPVFCRRGARKALALTVSVAMAVLLAAGRAQGDPTWRVTAGDWSDGGNWTGGEPTIQNAYITNGGTATISQAGETCKSLILGNTAGQSGSVNQTSGTLMANGVEYVGYKGTGLFTQSDGNNWAASGVYLGYYADSNGTYQLSGNGRLTGNIEIVGFMGTGTFTQSGGDHTATGSMTLGDVSGSTGTYHLSGNGTLNANIVEIGRSGSGVFIQSDGNHTLTADLTLGGWSGSSGIYQLDGDGHLAVGPSGVYHCDELVGNMGTGLFTQSGGEHTITGCLYLGYDRSASGTFQLSGNGRLTTGRGDSEDGEYVGAFGTGLFTQSGGENTINGSLYVAHVSGSSGVYELTGNARLTAATEYVGKGGRGVFAQSGGVNTVSGSLYMGEDWSGSGTYHLSENGSLKVGGNEFIGYRKDGNFVQSGGGNAVDGDLYLSYYTGTTGNYLLSDGNLAVGKREYVGYGGNGSYVQNGGTHTVGARLYLGDSDGNGSYVLSGGQLIVPRVTVGTKGSMTLSGGMLMGSLADANLLTGVVNIGLIEFVSGTWRLATIDCPDANAPAGTVVIDVGATLWVGELNQSVVYVSGTLILDSSLLSALSPAAMDGDVPLADGGGIYGDGSQPAPEPTTIVLLALGGTALLRRRRG